MRGGDLARMMTRGVRKLFLVVCALSSFSEATKTREQLITSKSCQQALRGATSLNQCACLMTSGVCCGVHAYLHGRGFFHCFCLQALLTTAPLLPGHVNAAERAAQPASGLPACFSQLEHWAGLEGRFEADDETGWAGSQQHATSGPQCGTYSPHDGARASCCAGPHCSRGDRKFICGGVAPALSSRRDGLSHQGRSVPPLPVAASAAPPRLSADRHGTERPSDGWGRAPHHLSISPHRRAPFPFPGDFRAKPANCLAQPRRRFVPRDCEMQHAVDPLAFLQARRRFFHHIAHNAVEHTMARLPPPTAHAD